MITLKLPIRKIEDHTFVEQKQKNYSCAFRTLYKRLEETADPNFIKEMKDRFGLNDIELREINPCYTSFIGNIQHPYGDSCSASIEIGRRGLFKYTNGMFYPQVTQEDIDTLEAIFGGDALCSTECNWVNMYKSLTKQFGNEEFQHRVRTMNVGQSPRSFSVNSYKSGINLLIII